MINVTQLSEYIYCPRKLFISGVLQLKEPSKESLVKGSIWHKTYDLINKGEKNIVISVKSDNYEEIFDLYKRTFAKYLREAIISQKSALKKLEISMISVFKEYWPNFEEEAILRASNIYSFIKKSNLLGEELWEKLTPKILSEQYFKSENLGISGIIDIIEVHETFSHEGLEKLYVPIELKTGSIPSKGIWDTHRIQLGAYLLLLEESGKKTGEGLIKYVSCKENRKVVENRVLVMDAFLKQEIKKTIFNVREILSSKEPPEKTSNKNKCSKCSFREICYNDQSMKKLLEEALEKRRS
ncbi:MAG: hypothetical protein KatS3mg002_0626 [Candidatus Woesearchaeota archaeon]|nr:MAG: hypothetical protein KatS3mg002_0626 [Candidatus Woesearchaeota archaeon]